ncbi:MAG: SRPBCC domain-containing protein [Chloroflexi bacterium]|nr:SRPBCC domain-containing protein [Chloroflexota bacterium]MCC6894457.1 SRPBCC domain-containing protein [Anaerolineae bacterium]
MSTVERQIWIDAPKDKVWEAITDPDLIAQWMVPNLPGAVLKLDDTGKVQVFLGPMGADFMVIKPVEAHRQLTTYSLPDQLLTATYTLQELDNGTQVSVTMGGFEKLPAAARDDRAELSGEGWERALQNLKAHLGGQPLPFTTAFVAPLFGFWRESRQKLMVERSIWINAPRERVWKAVTDPKQIQAWMSPSTEWQLTALEVGGRFYVPNPETNAEMHVEVITMLDPTSQLVTKVMPEPPDAIIKNKAYTLTEENGGTRLTVSLAGYEPEPAESRWNRMEENTFGYGMMLQNAKAYLEGGELPFPWGF